MKLYFLLFWEFFQTGLFSFGGGYATIPFLYQIANEYGWYTCRQLTDMIAISMLTPGPVGINMATFAGFQTSGINGALIASVALILPSFFIVISVSKILDKFNDNFYVKAVISSLKPVGCGLLTVVGINLFKENITDLYALILLTAMFLMSFKFRKNPLYYFAIGAFAGIILHIFNLK